MAVVPDKLSLSAGSRCMATLQVLWAMEDAVSIWSRVRLSFLLFLLLVVLLLGSPPTDAPFEEFRLRRDSLFIFLE